MSRVAAARSSGSSWHSVGCVCSNLAPVTICRCLKAVGPLTVYLQGQTAGKRQSEGLSEAAAKAGVRAEGARECVEGA